MSDEQQSEKQDNLPAESVKSANKQPNQASSTPSPFKKRQLRPVSAENTETFSTDPTHKTGQPLEHTVVPLLETADAAPNTNEMPEAEEKDLPAISIHDDSSSRGRGQATPWRRPHVSHIRYQYIRRRRMRERQVKLRKKQIGRTLLIILCCLLAIFISSGLDASFSYYQSQLPRVQSLANMQLDQSTHIYDRNGNLLYTLYNPKEGRSTPISYSQIPSVLQDAQIAAEDKTFWTNSGVDLAATVRSAIVDLVAKQAETGASTLTQQIVKNLSGNRDVSGQRKINEAMLAVGLTDEYPKWKILEMYFNIASYGAQELGVEAAVQDYFDLKPECDAHFNCIPATAFLDRDLSHCSDPSSESTCQSDPLLALARASLLAGIPQNPVNYDPTIAPGNLSALLGRQDYVLNQMLKLHMRINLGPGDQKQDRGAITADIVRRIEALSKQIQFVGFQNILKAPHFVWWIIQQLANALGSNQDIDPHTGLSISGLHLLLTGGFNIRTTLDLRIEQYVEQATQRHLNQPELQKLTGKTLTLSKDSNIHDAATVVMDAHTGEILAMDGSSNWRDSDPRIGGELNASLTLRQPASTFKPIVLAAAYEMGWYPGIVLQDKQTYFPIGAPQKQPVASYNTYEPTDYGSTYSGLSTNIDFAISNSLNIPAIKAYMYAGKQNVYTMAQRLGITTINAKQVNPTIALGTAEVPLLQMVGAYQVFADGGRRVPPHNILAISDNYGHLLYHYDATHPDGSQVISPQIASLITSTLSDESARKYEFHNDHNLSMWDWTLPDNTHPDVAAKTGTSDNFKDNWTIGYTPDLVVGVWAGNANGAGATNSIGMTGAAPLWHGVIEYASGHCNQANDQVPCPQPDFSYPDQHFSIPPGLAQQQVNTYNGLAGYGYQSWMLDGEQPMQRGR